MIRDIQPTYRVEGWAVCADGETLRRWRIHFAWNGRAYGRPTEKTVAAWRSAFLASCKPGGCNAHLGEQNIGTLRVIRQATGAVVAMYTPPMFEVAS